MKPPRRSKQQTGTEFQRTKEQQAAIMRQKQDEGTHAPFANIFKTCISMLGVPVSDMLLWNSFLCCIICKTGMGKLTTYISINPQRTRGSKPKRNKSIGDGSHSWAYHFTRQKKIPKTYTNTKLTAWWHLEFFACMQRIRDYPKKSKLIPSFEKGQSNAFPFEQATEFCHPILYQSCWLILCNPFHS